MKRTKVETLSNRSTMKALVLPRDTLLDEAIERFASNEGQHGIFLTDDDGRLTAVVNNKDLMDWARLQFDLAPGGSVPLPVGKVRRLMGARTIGELAVRGSKGMAVRLDDTLDEALRKMCQYDLEDIAVVDDDGAIVNDLRLSEVVSYALYVRRNGSTRS
jgi:CBS domain-containing protein